VCDKEASFDETRNCLALKRRDLRHIDTWRLNARQMCVLDFHFLNCDLPHMENDVAHTFKEFFVRRVKNVLPTNYEHLAANKRSKLKIGQFCLDHN
jgi:hypothetical protein